MVVELLINFTKKYFHHPLKTTATELTQQNMNFEFFICN